MKLYSVAGAGPTHGRSGELLRPETRPAASHKGTPAADASAETSFANEAGAKDAESRAKGTIHAAVWATYQSEFRAHWLESIARPGVQTAIDDSGRPVTTGGSGNVDKYGSENDPGGEVRVRGENGGPE